MGNLGLETEEVRAGIALLLEAGSIEETEDGYRVAGAEEKLPGPDEPAPSDEEVPRSDDAASPASVPGASQSYRAAYDVMVTFGGPGDRDEAALQKAAAMEEEIASAIHELYPNAVVAVETGRIEAYKPRVIYEGPGRTEGEG